MRILLLRHGQTQGNIHGRIQGPDDMLTELGHEQARLLGEYVAETWNVDRIYASSLRRARDTAAYVVNATSAPIEYDPRLAEIHAGDAIDMLWTDWREANPELAEVWGWDVRHADAGWSGGESGRDLSTRVFAAWDDIINDHIGANETVAVVSHGGPIAWLASRLHGDSLEVWPGAHSAIANCSVSEVEIDHSGEASIISWNFTDHLESISDQQSPAVTQNAGNEQ